MTMSDDILTIGECPKCGNSHKYSLEVQRSQSIGYTSLKARKSKIAQKCFTRLFTCPVTEEDFQASFWLTEEPNGSIRAVGVKSLAAESADEPQTEQ